MKIYETFYFAYRGFDKRPVIEDIEIKWPNIQEKIDLLRQGSCISDVVSGFSIEDPDSFHLKYAIIEKRRDVEFEGKRFNSDLQPEQIGPIMIPEYNTFSREELKKKFRRGFKIRRKDDDWKYVRWFPKGTMFYSLDLSDYKPMDEDKVLVLNEKQIR